MRLTFLGSGSAFSMKNYQSNMMITIPTPANGDMNLLIDCGSDIRFSLAEAGMSYKDIGAVYISHLHADHIGGLEYLAFCTFFDPSCEKPTLYISKILVDDLWNNSLRGGLGSIEGRVMALDDYFDVVPIDYPNGTFTYSPLGVGGIAQEFQLVQVVHIMDGFSLKPSFGLMFTINDSFWDNDKTIFITTDTQHNPNQISKFYDMSDMIIHDCETAPFMSKVHAHYKELNTLPEETKKKMVLCHYQDGDLPDAKADGFLGFAKQGEIIQLGGRRTNG